MPLYKYIIVRLSVMLIVYTTAIMLFYERNYTYTTTSNKYCSSYNLNFAQNTAMVISIFPDKINLIFVIAIMGEYDSVPVASRDLALFKKKDGVLVAMSYMFEVPLQTIITIKTNNDITSILFVCRIMLQQIVSRFFNLFMGECASRLFCASVASDVLL